jgi:hypothetical protein
MATDPFRGMRVIGDSAHPKADPATKSWHPKPGTTAQPKAPTETGQKPPPPPPAKHD